MRKSLQSVLLAAFVLAGSNAAPAHAADTPKPAADAAGSNGFHLPPLPADAHVAQSAVVDGRTLKYTATVG